MRGHRFEALDAWRGIAAVVVALVHLTTESVLHKNALVGNGTRFVDFFFVLSGFVIAHAYRERLQSGASEVWAFLIRRIGRLWPLHVVVLLAFIGLQVAIIVGGHLGLPVGERVAFARSPLDQIPANLLLIHAWGMYDLPSWNGVSWSISTELFAYCTFAAVCAAIPRQLISWLCASILGASLFVVATYAPAGMKSMADYGVFRCLFGFMAGVLVRSIWELRPLKLGTAGEIVTALGVVVAVAWIPKGDLTIFVVPVFAGAVWVFAAENGAVSRLLRRPPMQALGAWSYSIYMIHPLFTTVVLVANRSRMVMIDGRRSLDGPIYLVELITIAYVVAVVAFARLTHRYVELAGQRAFNRWAARLHAPRSTS